MGFNSFTRKITKSAIRENPREIFENVEFFIRDLFWIICQYGGGMEKGRVDRGVKENDEESGGDRKGLV